MSSPLVIEIRLCARKVIPSFGRSVGGTLSHPIGDLLKPFEYNKDISKEAVHTMYCTVMLVQEPRV